VPDHGREALSERRLVVVVLRLMVSGHGQLGYGEAVDVESEQRRRFGSWSELEAALRILIASAVERAADRAPRGQDTLPGDDRTGGDDG
jgi:hypothetical protein